MNVNLNTNVFAIRTNEYGDKYVDLTEDLKELAYAVRTVTRKWNEVKERNECEFGASREAIGLFRDVLDRMHLVSRQMEIEG